VPNQNPSRQSQKGNTVVFAKHRLSRIPTVQLLRSKSPANVSRSAPRRSKRPGFCPPGLKSGTRHSRAATPQPATEGSVIALRGIPPGGRAG